MRREGWERDEGRTLWTVTTRDSSLTPFLFSMAVSASAVYGRMSEKNNIEKKKEADVVEVHEGEATGFTRVRVAHDVAFLNLFVGVSQNRQK